MSSQMPYRVAQEDRMARARSRSVFIATPIARHPVRQYTFALARTLNTLMGLDIRAYIQIVAGNSNLPRARNELVAAFLASDYTDLLFIDDDMGWSPNDVVRLLASPQQVIGGVGAKKVPLPDTRPDKWCVRYLDDRYFVQDLDGNVEVDGVGAGFLKIARPVFETMMAAHPDWKRRPLPEMTPNQAAAFYRFFQFEDAYDGLGEDFAFCAEWQRLGGSVWVDPTIRLTHVGEMEFSGDFTALLQAQEFA